MYRSGRTIEELLVNKDLAHVCNKHANGPGWVCALATTTAPRHPRHISTSDAFHAVPGMPEPAGCSIGTSTPGNAPRGVLLSNDGPAAAWLPVAARLTSCSCSLRASSSSLSLKRFRSMRTAQLRDGYPNSFGGIWWTAESVHALTEAKVCKLVGVWWVPLPGTSPLASAQWQQGAQQSSFFHFIRCRRGQPREAIASPRLCRRILLKVFQKHALQLRLVPARMLGFTSGSVFLERAHTARGVCFSPATQHPATTTQNTGSRR